MRCSSPASYGLGEMVVQGAVNPDEFYVHKPTLAAGRPAILRRNVGSKAIKMIYAAEGDDPVTTVPVDQAERRVFCLTDEQIEELARQAMHIEQHYGRPMDIEWALDGLDGQLYIVQARPETVQSRQRQCDRTLRDERQVRRSGRRSFHRCTYRCRHGAGHQAAWTIWTRWAQAMCWSPT